jgi:hypothetical protein
MKTKYSWILSVLFLSVLPLPSHAQCRDKQDSFCRNLQYILYAAQTDFRSFQGPEEYYDFGLFPQHHSHNAELPNPDLSFAGAKVPCQLSAWTNGVSMYICEGRVAIPDAEKWYEKTLAEFQQLQYSWHFKVESPGVDHYVDAGPANCDVPATDGLYITEGPYAGQCPLHIQTVREPDGTDSVHLWVNSYTSPFLALRQGGSNALSVSKAPPAGATVQTVSAQSAQVSASSSSGSSAADKKADDPAPAARATCDEFCQNLKKILEERWIAFKALSGASAAQSSVTAKASPVSGTAIKLAGASSCSISTLSLDSSRSASRTIPLSQVRLTPASLKDSNKSANAPPPATQYVCYWPESSPAAAQGQFQNLVSVLQFLIPSTWSVEQRDEADELSGAQVTVWTARDASNKPAIGLYKSGDSVGLHVASSSE